MTESIPTTESIKALVAWASVQDLPDDERTAPRMAEARRRFDAWIAAVERAAAEKALTDFAEQWATAGGIEALMFAHDDVSAVQITEKALLARAEAYRREGKE